MPKLEFFFDFISPYSYIAFHALPEEMADHVDRIDYKPIFLGAVMKATGNRPPGLVPAKGTYLGHDLARCSKRYGIDFRLHPEFPMMNTRPALRAACGLSEERDLQKQFIAAIFHHVWAAPDPLMTADPDQLGAVCEAEGLPADRILELAWDDATTAVLKDNTDEAISRGAFGAPSFFVGDELFFGHDRLEYAAEAMRLA